MPVRSHTLLSALLGLASAALLATPARPAHAGDAIVKCVDSDGRVTVTDRDCDGGVATVLVAATDSVATVTTVTKVTKVTKLSTTDTDTPLAQRPGTARQAANMAPQTQRWSTPRARTAMLAGDAATLRAARSSLQALDDASAAARHQRLAGLN